MAKIEYNILNREIPKSEFECGVATIDGCVYNSYIETITQHAMAIECLVDKQPVGYCMITFKEILLDDLPEEISEYNTNLCNYCTSAHIQYIAVKKDLQGYGYGTKIIAYLIKYVMSLVKYIPIRLITLDAFKHLTKWYSDIGFKIIGDEKDYNNEETVKMYIDCITEDNLNKLNTYDTI